MHLGVPNESGSGESRVAIVPEVLPKLARLGLEVHVESGAGLASGYPDDLFEAKGAKLVDREAALAAPIVAAIGVPTTALARGQMLVCMPDPLGQPGRIKELAACGASCFALELMRGISRAQAMDVLSSMANVAGYKAVLLGAARLPKMFPLMMTAAGTVRPARVFILGAGVAGLQAIATARRLGAVVEGYDIRPETKEQVESLGAKFLEFDLGTQDAQTEGGYARELSDDEKKKQAELMAEAIQACDVVVTTAQVPGRRAPLLIPADVVRGMKPGSVIVDMAAESGGNCELSVAGEEVDEGGVIILGPKNLPGSVSTTTSQLYANNLLNFFQQLFPRDEEGNHAMKLDLDDETLFGPLVCHEGEITEDRVRSALGEGSPA